MGLLQALRLRRRSVWDPPTALDIFLSSPLQWAMSRIYHLILLLRGAPFRPSKEHRRPIRVVCLSDTHDRVVSDVPDGDLLIHAGDLTTEGTAADVQKQIDWLASLPHRHKVVVAGNHDSWFDESARRAEDRREGGKEVDLKGVEYLQDRLVTLEFEGGRILNVYGAGDIPQCGGASFAFQYPRDETPWDGRIPMETDVLVTHGPPRYHMDLNLGCAGLLTEVWRVKPKLHVFGHVHWGHGRESVFFDSCQKAYEELMSRPKKGPLYDLFPNSNWREALKIVRYGISSLLWKWLMAGPGSNNAGLMINAAQIYGNTGKLGNKVQVVDL
ncbi:calcineurin-like phosphoesterase [Coniochaeta sp. 2T2.1]|nr:calcineurin-like phosphoesterase [Coniochaeta sp. 2T2.1]